MPKRIAAFGEVVMRLQVPGYELLSQADTLKYTFSGTGVNVASALARYGHIGELVTVIPDNPLGDAAVAALRKLGISPTFFMRGGDSLRMYFLENGFGVRPSRVTNVNRLGSGFNQAPENTFDFQAIAKDIDVVHFCGITLAMNDKVRRQMKTFAEAVKAYGGRVVFDCNYRPALWGKDGYVKARPHYEAMLHYADIVLMNEKDAIHVLGMEATSDNPTDQVKELLPSVADNYKISVIAGTHRTVNSDHTHSLQGFIYKGHRFTFSKRLTFSVQDRIGSGDAFASGVIHGEMKGFSAEETLAFASTAAMLAHTVVGDTPMASEGDVLRAMEAKAIDLER
ncbi:sugar kinase [Camelliibacillus cellulosilyticus]|uniref:Sugar kinase n=1 Tax=Camelliibacillus cellulosilyticus TaxID=2174486 RepID=A0ABV9GMR8_9BACL